MPTTRPPVTAGRCCEREAVERDLRQRGLRRGGLGAGGQLFRGLLGGRGRRGVEGKRERQRQRGGEQQGGRGARNGGVPLHGGGSSGSEGFLRVRGAKATGCRGLHNLGVREPPPSRPVRLSGAERGARRAAAAKSCSLRTPGRTFRNLGLTPPARLPVACSPFASTPPSMPETLAPCAVPPLSQPCALRVPRVASARSPPSSRGSSSERSRPSPPGRRRPSWTARARPAHGSQSAAWAAAREQAARVAPADVRSLDERRGVPSFLRVRSATPVSPTLARPTAETAAREHLARFAPWYRLGAADVKSATLRQVHDTGSGGVIATFTQSVDGIEVYGDQVRCSWTASLAARDLRQHPERGGGQTRQGSRFRALGE